MATSRGTLRASTDIAATQADGVTVAAVRVVLLLRNVPNALGLERITERDDGLKILVKAMTEKVTRDWTYRDLVGWNVSSGLVDNHGALTVAGQNKLGIGALLHGLVG